MASVKPSSNSSSKEKLHQAYNLAGEAASDTASHIREQAANKAAHLRDRARSSVERGKHRATDMEHRLEESIQRHPLVSVGCAFAAGWLISKILK
ncbi:hypothetical protein AUP74_01571 [Microbulbifer aggregans]|uniref:DUF883 domain-containing protein n=1 Tax=Microbulbifer aggregans TaxID=1769779 RepID=A0A1C9W775_9GAMM|nr:DUF883 family protein [Microbulbifer aggregans]AOS97006.1 hypothetical protein AUP74_01571 [Microbulbifer aggregans]